MTSSVMSVSILLARFGQATQIMPLGAIAEVKAGLATLKAALRADPGETTLAEAEHARDALLPAMAAVRSAADALEGVVADDLWPLPSYQEMLYIL